jgi:hypothetical protein
MIATGVEEGAGPKLEWQPLDVDRPGGLEGMRLHVRVGTDDVVVEADLSHRMSDY